MTGAAEMRRLGEAMTAMAAELDARFKLVNRQREEMRLVFENMSEGILAVDGAGRVILVNRAAQAILHLPEEAAASTIESVCRNADLLDALQDTRSADHSLEREIRVPRDDDAESLVLVHTAAMRGEGDAVGVLAVLRDVTRLRHLEIMRRDFVANVSHELRTPITTIQSCLETIQDEGRDDTPNAQFVEMAVRNTRRMGAVIDNLLFLAGMESGAGRAAGQIAIHPLRPVLEEAADLCRGEAATRKCVIALECDDDATALMNPQLVVHAVLNLLDNAVKYGPEGGSVVVAAARGGNRVRITVTDQGPGIPSGQQSRVFERFYRLDGPVRVKEGAGLGLAIVKHIALAQGGDIRLESEIGAGSRFTLSLPPA